MESGEALRPDDKVVAPRHHAGSSDSDGKADQAVKKWHDRWRRFHRRPSGKANRLAVTALIIACLGPFMLGGIPAIVFGSVALSEIRGSEGAERGAGMARWAIVLGFVNVIVLVAAIAVTIIVVDWL